MDGFDALDIVELGLGQRLDLGHHVDAGQVQPEDGFIGTNTVDCRQEGFHVEPMLDRPCGPDAFCGGDRQGRGPDQVPRRD
ncbi:hypothetical protein, partial [Sphingopyxis sp.]|uniref:hypothetical protein n=1 Tax=Sphingopyxis sp. TaxID=1908224 RepID=UPI003D6C8FCC